MNTKLLKAFVVLAEKGSYAEAAATLAMTQPALTKQINLFESQLNFKLFDRGRQGTALTSGGIRLLPEAEKVLKQSALFMQHAEQIATGKEGRIAIGFGLSSFAYAPECIAKFRKQFPDVDVTLQDLPSSQQSTMLQDGELQIGFVRIPPEPSLSHHTLFEDRLVLITPENRPLSVATWLETLPLLRLQANRGQGLNAQTDLFFHENHHHVRSTQYAEDIHTLLAMVIAGIGVALLPQSIVHIAPATLNIVALKGRTVSWKTGIAWDAKIPDLIRDNFIEMVLSGMND